ncbi:aberrant root formation protein 4 isoform X2 [Nymphaea colorata]|nr:aberrant root formation protein 4 isoform X2 [Nymphaea colorata]
MGSATRALEVVKATHELINGLNEEVVDALSLDLPKAIVKFVGVSEECSMIVDQIIDSLCEKCNPRDMLSIFCEALDFFKSCGTAKPYVPLFRGISHVFLCTRRRHFEQIKTAVPMVLNVLESASSELSEEDDGYLHSLFERGTAIASSIQEVCGKLVGNDKWRLNALLGAYILQVMALVSKVAGFGAASSRLIYICQLSRFLLFCGFSYLNLVTGDDVDAVISRLVGEDSDHLLACFPSMKHGASLAVLWGYVSDEVAKHAGEEFSSVLLKLQNDRNKRYKAICFLKHLLSSAGYSWELKGHCIDFVLNITDDRLCQNLDAENYDCSSCFSDMLGTLQAVELVIVYASDATIRKKAFSVLKRVLADLPSGQRFDILHVLIAKSSYPSMTALLIDLAKEHFAESYKRSRDDETDMQIEEKIIQQTFDGCRNILDLVELVLKPPKGGPPSLPEDSDAVVSVLNLYRFILLLESSGKTNYSCIFLISKLQKAYNEWFLPLRTLVSGIQAENAKDNSEIAQGIESSLNLIQLVLCHCIELVEQYMRNPIASC